MCGSGKEIRLIDKVCGIREQNFAARVSHSNNSRSLKVRKPSLVSMDRNNGVPFHESPPRASRGLLLVLQLMLLLKKREQNTDDYTVEMWENS